MGKVIVAAANPVLMRPASHAPVGRKSRAALPTNADLHSIQKRFSPVSGTGEAIAKYRKGQIIFSQGDAGDAVFYIQKGKAKVTVVSEQGKEAVVAILGADEFFGEGCLAGQVQRISTVTAMTDAIIVRLEKAAIVQVIHREPAFSEMFIAHLLGRSIRVEAILSISCSIRARNGLPECSCCWRTSARKPARRRLSPKISQETLAEMIGTTRSRVSFFMNKFRKLGFIEYNGGIEGGIEVQQLIVECRSARAAANQKLNLHNLAHAGACGARPARYEQYCTDAGVDFGPNESDTLETKAMSLGLILVIILVIFLFGGFSGRFGGYGYGYGHGGVGVIGVILIIIVVLMLLGRI